MGVGDLPCAWSSLCYLLGMRTDQCSTRKNVYMKMQHTVHIASQTEYHLYIIVRRRLNNCFVV